MAPELERALPEAHVRWYQGGSENVAARVNTELYAGRTQADLILTSDPFWYDDLKRDHKLLAYDSPAAREVPPQYADPDHFFTTVRMCVMVMDTIPRSSPARQPGGPISRRSRTRASFRWEIRSSPARCSPRWPCSNGSWAGTGSGGFARAASSRPAATARSSTGSRRAKSPWGWSCSKTSSRPVSQGFADPAGLSRRRGDRRARPDRPAGGLAASGARPESL